MPILTLKIHNTELTIHRLAPSALIPQSVLTSTFYSITRTPSELSIVCPSSVPLSASKSEPGWCSLEVLGPLNFALTGILAGLSGYLAASGISIFAISTFDTDYILIKAADLEQGCQALSAAGYKLI